MTEPVNATAGKMLARNVPDGWDIFHPTLKEWSPFYRLGLTVYVGESGSSWAYTPDSAVQARPSADAAETGKNMQVAPSKAEPNWQGTAFATLVLVCGACVLFAGTYRVCVELWP